MSWQRPARFAAAAVGLGCAVALWAYRREPPPAPPPVTLAPVDRAAVAEGGEATRMLFEGASTRARMTVTSWRRYENPERVVNFGVTLLFMDEGLEITSDEAEFRGTETAESSPQAIDFAGHVKVKTNDGLEVRSSRATYDSAAALVTMPEPVQFAKGRMSGSGSRGTYDRNQELLQLEEQAAVAVSPDAEGHGGLHATARHLTAARLEKFARLEEQAEIVTETDTLRADSATMYFTDDEEHLKLADLQGHASVDPVVPPGGRATRPAMTANAITLTFGPDSHALERATLNGQAVATVAGGQRIVAPWIDLGLGADGGLTAIDARPQVQVTLPAEADAPARIITAATLAGRGAAGRGLTSARFDAAAGGLVRFEEQPAQGTPTTADSRVLVLGLDGGLDTVRQAEFREDVRFTSGQSVALSDWAQYDAAARSLTLDAAPGGGQPGAPPQVTQEGLWVSARRILLGIDSHDLEARTDVSTRLRRTGESARRPSALFDGSSEDVIGAADHLTYRSKDGHAVYEGREHAPARLTQKDGSTVEGQRITLDDAAGTLNAAGQVQTTFFAADPPAKDAAPGPPVKYVGTSETFDYADETRTGVYQGDPATLRAADRRIEARRIEVRLQAEARALEHLTATTAVYATLAGGDYEAKSDTLDYDAATGVYVFEGKPVEMRAPDAERRGCIHTTGGQLARIEAATRTPTWPAIPANRQIRHDPTWPCGKSIR